MSAGTEQPKLAETGSSSRRLLFWIVLGVVVLNVVLFARFGLGRKPGQTEDRSPTNSPTGPAATNAAQHSIAVQDEIAGLAL